MLKILNKENGIATIVVIGVMMVISILVVGLIFMAVTERTASRKGKYSERALHVADSGIDRALWYLRNLKPGESLPSTFEVVVEGEGTATVVTKVTGADFAYEVVSTGRVQAPFGDIFRRAIKVQVYGISIWQMYISASPEPLTAGGNGVEGNTAVIGPFYIRGNVPLSGNSFIKVGPLMIKNGYLSFQSNSALVETTTMPLMVTEGVYDARGGGQLIRITDPVYPPLLYCKEISETAPELELPALEADKDYQADAANESIPEHLNTSSTLGYPTKLGNPYKVVDIDSFDWGGSNINENTPLIISSITPSFGMWDGNGDGYINESDSLYWKFAWDQTNKTLYIDGTIFVDGPVYLGGTVNGKNTCDITYKGNGKIVANGSSDVGVVIWEKLIPPSGELTSTSVMGLVTDKSIYMCGDGANNDVGGKVGYDVAGAFFTPSKIVFVDQTDSFKDAANLSFSGSCIAGLLKFGDKPNNQLFTHPQLPNFLPRGMPGADILIVSLSGWHEIKPK